MKNSPIQWCHSTWSPWLGYSKVSPGCAHCYIIETAPFRTRKLKHGDPRQRTSEAYWRQPLIWNKKAGVGKVGPLSPALSPWEGEREKRPRIFPSLCDWLDDQVPIEWLADFLKLIHDTPNLDWLLLSKRPENWIRRLQEFERGTWWNGDPTMIRFYQDWLTGVDVPSNVWLGVSVEDQQHGDRISSLLKIPAKVRFLSLEPLLEAIDIFSGTYGDNGAGQVWDAFGKNAHCPHGEAPLDGPGVSWVIVGGETGPGARPCNVEWIRSIVAQCKAAPVACFVKQLGSEPGFDPKNIHGSFHHSTAGLCIKKLKDKKGGDPAEWPEDLRVREFPTPFSPLAPVQTP